MGKEITEAWARDVINSMQWPGNPAGKYTVDEIFAPGAEVRCNGQAYDTPQQFYEWLHDKLAPMQDKSCEIKSLVLGHVHRGMSWHSVFKSKPPGSSKEIVVGVATVAYLDDDNRVTGWYEIGGSYTPDAIAALNSLQSNAAVLADIRANWRANAHLVIPETIEYLRRAGYKPHELNKLNVLHVAGTKGKGSTCAFLSSILCQLYPETNIGLYTSPHLVAVRERIRINGVPIAEDKFARYFFEIWDRFGEAAPPSSHLAPRPAYARFLTILAFHVFLSERVYATVLEVGIGGTYDATNVVPFPIAAGVTALGYDHTAILGHTLPEIAAHKAGIYKCGVPALTVHQPVEALDVLHKVSQENKSHPLRITKDLPESALRRLGLAGKHQLQNAGMATALARTFAETFPPQEPHELMAQARIAELIDEGLWRTRWPGRCQICRDRQRATLSWYLDGAHTAESLRACAEWFARSSSLAKLAPAPAERALIFNITSDRTVQSLLASLVDGLVKFGHTPSSALFAHVIFCTNTTYRSGVSKGDLSNVAASTAATPTLATQQALAEAWQSSVPEIRATVCGSVEEAVDLVRSAEAASRLEVLVTGSLHLIGGIMEVTGLPVD